MGHLKPPTDPSLADDAWSLLLIKGLNDIEHPVPPFGTHPRSKPLQTHLVAWLESVVQKLDDEATYSALFDLRELLLAGRVDMYLQMADSDTGSAPPPVLERFREALVKHCLDRYATTVMLSQFKAIEQRKGRPPSLATSTLISAQQSCSKFSDFIKSCRSGSVLRTDTVFGQLRQAERPEFLQSLKLTLLQTPWFRVITPGTPGWIRTPIHDEVFDPDVFDRVFDRADLPRCSLVDSWVLLVVYWTLTWKFFNTPSHEQFAAILANDLHGMPRLTSIPFHKA